METTPQGAKRGTRSMSVECRGKHYSSLPYGRSWLGSEDSGLDGKPIQLRTALQAELLAQPSPVRLDGLHAHLDLRGDLLVGVPLCQEPEHLALARAQVLRALRLGA